MDGSESRVSMNVMMWAVGQCGWDGGWVGEQIPSLAKESGLTVHATKKIANVLISVCFTLIHCQGAT